MEWSQMRENACHKTCYSVLKKARPAYLEDIKTSGKVLSARLSPMTAGSSKQSAWIMEFIQNSL